MAMKVKPRGDGKGREGRPEQVSDFYSPYWRVRVANDDWEKMTASEKSRFGV